MRPRGYCPGRSSSAIRERRPSRSPIFNSGRLTGVDAAAAALLPPDIFDLNEDTDTDEPLPLDLADLDRLVGAALDLGAFERPVTSEEPVLQGDLNGDGFVNASDLDLIRANWGNDVPPGDLLSGDANGDGTVNADDLNVIRANWGAVAAADAADALFDSLADEPAYGDPVYNEPVYGPALPRRWRWSGMSG